MRSRDDTKYFDEEDPISDVDDATSQDLEQDAPDFVLAQNEEERHAIRQLDGANGQVYTSTKAAIDEVSELNPKGKKGKEGAKKRPRDKVLRDKEFGRKVLDLRKKGAFIGYTYRRPRLIFFEDDCVRQRHARRSLIPSFATDL